MHLLWVCYLLIGWKHGLVVQQQQCVDPKTYTQRQWQQQQWRQQGHHQAQCCLHTHGPGMCASTFSVACTAQQPCNWHCTHSRLLSSRKSCTQVASASSRQHQTRQHAAHVPPWQQLAWLMQPWQQPQGRVTAPCLHCQRSTCTSVQVSTTTCLPAVANRRGAWFAPGRTLQPKHTYEWLFAAGPTHAAAAAAFAA